MSKRSAKIKKSRRKAMRKAKTSIELVMRQLMHKNLLFFFASVWCPMVDKLTLFSNFTIRFVVAYSSSSLHCLAGRWVVSW
jgi:hypothetical protein